MDPQLRESLLYPSEGSLMVPTMAHNGVLCLEIHLRIPAVVATHGFFFRPSRSWLLRSFSFYAPVMAEAVGRNDQQKIF